MNFDRFFLATLGEREAMSLFYVNKRVQEDLQTHARTELLRWGGFAALAQIDRL